MCTSLVAGNTQRLVSMGKQRKRSEAMTQCNGKSDMSNTKMRLPHLLTIEGFKRMRL